MQWEAPGTKPGHRARLAASTRAPAEAACRNYNSCSPPVLSHLAQFFPIPSFLLRKEHWLLHELLRLPPNTFKRSGLLSLRLWHPGSAHAATMVLGRVSAWRLGLSAWAKAREFAQLLSGWRWWHGSSVGHVGGE
eukprot:8659128-Pyramimonas_sp.AAC.1